MPYMYAIHERIDRTEDHSYQDIYHPVSKDVAEHHPQGMAQLVTIHGKPVSDWCHVRYLQNNTDGEYGKGKPLTDCLGQPLAAHDYVTTTKTGYVRLHVGEVVNFTAQKVRIKLLGGDTILRSPNELTKVSTALFH